MATAAPAMNAQIALHLHQVQVQLAQAAHGSKAPIVARAAADLGVKETTVYRWLAQHVRPRQGPLASQRKRRCDAGERAITDDELRDISAALLASFRRNGHRIMTFENAVQMLRDNGVIATDLSAGRIATILTERGLHPSQMTRPTPTIEHRSLHPNHVWQVDASVCVAYYLSNATGLQVMDEKKFYKNKPRNLSRIQEERLIRYAMADHYTHEILTRYYLGSECSAHLADFLIWCFAPKDGHPVHGVPFLVEMDMGSANTSAPVLNMLDRLDVRYTIHERHNSRANGSAEKANHLIEVNFESGLRFARVAGLEDLNNKGLTWANYFGATSIHSRYSRTRHNAWLTITAEQLRLAPAIDLMRTLPTSHPEKRRVSNNLTIEYSVRGHGPRDYRLRYVPGIMAGQWINVVVNGLMAPAVEVEYADPESGELMWVTVHPVERDDMNVAQDAPIKGVELRAAPRGLLDKNRDDVMQRAFGGTTPEEAAKAQEKGALAFGGRVDPFKRAAEAKLPAFMPKRGTPLDVPGRQVEAPRVSAVAATKRIREALVRIGQAERFGPHVYAWLSERFGKQGVPDDQVDGLVVQFAAPVQASPAAPTGLRAVGGTK